MIKEKEVEKIIKDDFSKYMKPIRKISEDTAGGQSMIDWDACFYDYDKIGEKVYRRAGENKPKTPDMIIFEDDTIYFVEFKNGKISDTVKDEIKVKAIEGGFIVLHKILSQAPGVRPDFPDIVKLNKGFILVYNKQKNPGAGESRARIHNHVAAKKVEFGLDIYKDTFFNAVAVFTPEGFKEWLKENERIDNL